MASNTEDFWNNSSGNAFNFDDDFEQEKIHSTLESNPSIKNSVFTSSLEDESALAVLPLHSIITKNNLNAVLDDMHLSSSMVFLPIEDMILKMYLGQPYTLSMYRTLDDKLKLLDEALLIADGNVIIAVLQYIRRSLKVSTFYYHLTKRKVALEHYITLLMKELNFEELSNVYLYVRNFVDMVYLFYLDCRDFSNKSSILYKLTSFLRDQQLQLYADKKSLFLECQKFTKWQVENNFPCSSVTEQLVELYGKDWSEKKINEFKQFFQISDFQYEWITLNALCSLQIWSKLTGIFIKPNWLSKKNVFKSVINIDLFILTISAHNCPKYVLSEFLACVPDNEEAIRLAEKVCCHKFVIDFYNLQKDRQSLINYKSCLLYGSEDFFYAQNILQSTDKKWKN